MLGDRDRQVGDALGVDVRQPRAGARREREGAGQPDRLGLLGDQVLDRQIAEQLHAIAPAALGGRERATRAVDQPLDRPQRIARAHCSDRDRHGEQGVVVERYRQRSDEPADLLGQAAQHLVVRHARREHDELLTAPAAEHVVAAQPPLQAHGDLAQDAIADGMAIDVVDAPEVVEIEQHHTRWHAGAL